MGSGCSSVDNVRQRIRRNIICTQSRRVQNNLKGTANNAKEDTETQEEDDAMDVLSPMSEMGKLGSGQTRGLSAASTVLPGTSISFSPVTEELSEFESYKPLPDLGTFPEDIRHLLMGHCSANDLNDNQEHRDVFLLVLINGTDGFRFFEELKMEIISSLKKLAFENDTNLHVYIFGHQPVPCGYDFRQLIRNFIRFLLKTEIVITLTIFGRAEIHVQPPDVIEQSDFDVAVTRMTSVDSRETIHCSYLADVNDIKSCYRLQAQPPNSTDWQQHAYSVIQILETAFDEKLKDKYLTSVFEDILSLFKQARDEVLESRSALIHLESSSDLEDKPKRESIRVLHLLSEWESKIPDEFKFNYFKGDSWEELWNGDIPTNQNKQEGVFSSLESRLRDLLYSIVQKYKEEKKYFAKVAGKGIDWQLRNELLHQQSEIHFHLDAFQDRPDLLASIMSYIAGPQSHPLVVRGRQGRGKSALLAVASVLCGAVFPNMPILMRSTGVSSESFTQEQILRSVCEHLAFLYGKHPSVASRSIAEHNSFFSILLRRVCAERPLVIILDGLDQVEEYSGRSLKWFPTVLPQHVKLIVAVRDGSSELFELQELLSGEETAFLEIPDLEIEDTLSIIQHQLRLKNRRLTDSQLSFARICVTDNSYPRYAHIFAHVASEWHSLSIPEQFWARHAVYDIFCDYLKRISIAVDVLEIRKFLATLVTLKHGMMESEIFHLLQLQSASLGLTETDCPLSLIYLKHHLSPILRTSFRRGHMFFHYRCQLYRKLCKTYLGKELLEESLQATLEYVNMGENNFGNNRRVANLIKTNHKHQRWRELEELTPLRIRLNISVRKDFFDHQWLLERVSLGDIYSLLEEIKIYKRRNPDDREIDTLRKFLQLSSYALRCDGRQLYTQFYGRAKGLFVDAESHFKYLKVKKLVKVSSTPPVPSFHTSGPCLRTLVEAQKAFPVSSKSKDSLDKISWLDNDATYLVTYSSSKGEISGWNAYQTKRMVTMKEDECVVGLKTLGRNAEVLVLHHNRMEVVDLAKSIVKTRMKELIDVSQGVVVLDGGKSILAISEGHDEILRFDTCSGHVGSRIFCGENRQLDCLLVSGNGEVCVCGDAFQKPFPLFAWDVQSGVQLRHFSLPHHEFLARLSGINDDGKLLFATAKELLDSSSTFLLAYDMTTGSVVWEAKPDSNITAINVCSETERVIVATEDGSIHGWNMHTGEEGFVFSAPSSSVDRIETAKNKTFLTWDSISQNRCLRVWDTVTGQNIATFTADYNIYDCIFSNEGNNIALIMCNKDEPAMLSLKNNQHFQEAHHE